MKTELFPGKFCLFLEYTISKTLSNYVELAFKDKGQSSFIGDTKAGQNTGGALLEFSMETAIHSTSRFLSAISVYHN